MNRREFLVRTGLTAAGMAIGPRAFAATEVGRWRTFEITTRVRVLEPRGVTRVWLPTPLASAPYQHTMGDNYHPGDGTAVMIETTVNEPDMLGCSWDEGVEPVVTLVSRVAVGDAAVNLEGGGTDVDKARAICDATTDAAVFVERCRAAGMRARMVYGLHLLPDATEMQQRRAEVQLATYGWVPVDAAERRFGSWETNWIAYNTAEHVLLRGSKRPPLAYFMHPQGETAEGPLDSLAPERFKYSIAVQEIATAPAPRAAN
jgi:hypothetical protein